jgi:hypothetical protein
MDSNEAIYVVGGGEVVGIAGGPISLGELGPRKTARLSRVEFNDATNLWEVKSPDIGTVIHSGPDYDECIKWETNFFNRMLELNPESPVFSTTNKAR